MPSEPEGPTPEQIEAAEDQIVEQSKRIEFYISEYSVELLAQKMRDGEYVVPDYQREFTWESERKSKFIESLLMGLPIPFMFFWEMPDGRLEVVDGSQRLRTISQFLYGGFRLGVLEKLGNVSGLRFQDLPDSRQRKIKNRSIRGIILNEHADEASRFDMFERINTGSKIANKAEVRRGALRGPFLDVVIELASLPLFVSLAPISSKQKDEREYEELVTRFFAYGDGLTDYHDRPSDFVFDYSKKMNLRMEKSPELADSYRKRFTETIEFIDRVFPFGFRRGPNLKATPRTRFEAISIGSFLAMQERPDLTQLPADQIGVDSWISGYEFRKIIGADGANGRARLAGRINYVKDKLVNS
jgi:Protein of unknown function DUF262